jgi:cobaltochelatase CobT
LSDQLLIRHQQKVEELCAASLRAVAADSSLYFRGRRLYRNTVAQPLHAPHLYPSFERDNFLTFRGAADGLCLRLMQSDAALHERLAPHDSVERLLFNVFEQFRVEALVPEKYPGMRSNLLHCFESWSMAFHGAGLTESANGLLLFSVAHMCRSRVTGDPIDDDTSDRIETTRGAVGHEIGTSLAGLRATRAEQSEYAVYALDIASKIAFMMQSAQEVASRTTAQGESIESTAFALLNFEAGDQATASAGMGNSKLLEASSAGYRIFSTQFDKQASALSLVRKAEAIEYREALDKKLSTLGVNPQRVARRLNIVLAKPLEDGWNSGEEEGMIDGRRLAQLIATPAERRLFVQPRLILKADCAVTILVDCSGSMKAHIQQLAALIDLLVRGLDAIGAHSEVLGFTTSTWTGGRPQKQWLKEGKPEHPGRLNESLHIVFKDAQTSWRKARPGISTLLKAELFREGIDGEAVLWASKRLKQSEARRKVLLVISDGSPMDSATHLANDDHYLDHHLRQVVEGIEAQRPHEIMGIGVGLDMSLYYRRSLVLDLAVASANQSLNELMGLLARR